MEPSADLVLARETPALRRGSPPGSGGRRGRPQWGGALLRNETRAGKGRILGLSAPGLGLPRAGQALRTEGRFPKVLNPSYDSHPQARSHWPVALDGHAAAGADLRIIVPQRLVLDAAIVPEGDRMRLPEEAHLEFLAR